jgi:hypothetical protein
MLAGGLTPLVLAKEDMLTVSRAQACPLWMPNSTCRKSQRNEPTVDYEISRHRCPRGEPPLGQPSTEFFGNWYLIGLSGLSPYYWCPPGWFLTCSDAEPVIGGAAASPLDLTLG